MILFFANRQTHCYTWPIKINAQTYLQKLGIKMELYTGDVLDFKSLWQYLAKVDTIISELKLKHDIK